MAKRTIENIIRLINTVAYRFSTGYDEKSTHQLQSWSNGADKDTIEFTDCTTRCTSRAPSINLFTARLNHNKNMEFVDARTYSVRTPAASVGLESCLQCSLEEAKLPRNVKEFLADLNRVCMNIAQDWCCDHEESLAKYI